jgi:pimeloyl-ACP methyl ester carboxylesterase
MHIMQGIRLVCLSISCLAIVNGTSTKNLIERKEMNHTENPTSKHPQEPVPPYPYAVHEVTYRNEAADITLAGTLTTPNSDGPFATVILIAGMGAVNRDGMMYGHKLYFVLADYLTRRGIAVLRVDKRGIGASTGSFGMQVTSRDLADDVLAGVNYLKTRVDVDRTRIGLVGISEGGFIASLLAAESDDIAYVISMAGAVGNSPELLAEQTALQLRFDGASSALIITMQQLTQEILTIVRNEPDAEQAENMLNELVTARLHLLPQELQQEATRYPFAISPTNAPVKIKVFNSPWYRWLLAQNMDQILQSIRVPLLAMYGERDFMAPHLMLPHIEQALQKGGNLDYTLIAMPSLNHAFQTCVTGALAEYATITETISPTALTTIGDWIVAHTR